jgi:pimeloyl-ACP methyl ester carboxylesterase
MTSMNFWTSLLVVLALSATPAAAQQRAPHAVDPDGVAGWYSAPGATFLISWGPKGGYRLLDFEAARFLVLHRESADLFTVRADGPWKQARVRVHPQSSGDKRGLRIELADQTVIEARAASQYPFDLEEVRVRSSDDVTLGGLLLLPRVRKLVGRTGQPLSPVPIRLPAATVLHGSGDSDRDNMWAFTFAWAMARTGFVTLFLDKRGSGASGGDWRTTGLDGLTDDAVAGIDFLRAHSRVDASRVGVIGLSQGGLVAGLATARRQDLAFAVSVSSAPMPLFRQMRHELAQDLRRASMPEEGIASLLAVSELAAGYSRSHADADWNAYVAALERLRNGPLARAAAAFPARRDDWHWAWWRKVGDNDPLPAWRGFPGAALAVFGEEDESDNVPVETSVRLLNDAWRPERVTNKTIRVFDDRGHTLVDPVRKWIDRDVLAFITEWALRVVGGLDRAQ